MSSSVITPSLSLKRLSLGCSDSLISYKVSSFVGLNNGNLRFRPRNVDACKVHMSVSIGSQTSVDDALFSAHQPTFASAFLFPGQGAQTVGMGAEVQNVLAATTLFSKANDILGFDLLDICINGPKDKLDSTVLSQPAIYVTSLAAVEILRACEGGQQIIDSVDVTCGLSLREYTALAFSGTFSFKDGLKLVKLRGEAMQGNYAVSGEFKGIEAVEAKAKSFKAHMTVRVAVAGAFHTRFMEPAVSNFVGFRFCKR